METTPKNKGIGKRSGKFVPAKKKARVDAAKPSIKMNETYTLKNFLQTVKEKFQKSEEYHHDSDVILHSEPFSCCSMSNFLEDKEFLEGVRDELIELEFKEKNNDLYQFHQTEDLRTVTTPYIEVLREFLYTHVLAWMREVTDIPLTEKVDMTSSRYEDTDVLLCHDDELDSRRIAYILYLVPPWTADDGGCLDLYSSDTHGQPASVVMSLVPAWNMFNWFEVSESSHHQVAEVLSEDKVRLSINGWFHGPIIPRPERYMEPAPPLNQYGNIDEDRVREWVSPAYWDIEMHQEIQDAFEANSEIQLPDFIREDKYASVVEALVTSEIEWRTEGPPNKRHCCTANLDSCPAILQELIQVFQSEVIFLILSNLTGLKLHELAESSREDVDCSPDHDDRACGSGSGPEDDDDGNQQMSTQQKTSEAVSNPCCRLNLHRWKHRNYTLLHDTDSQAGEYALDLVLYCACDDWKQEYGGYTSYIARGEDEELLSMNPSPNSLGLVYRDKDTMHFVKYLNHKTNTMHQQGFFTLTGVYYE